MQRAQLLLSAAMACLLSMVLAVPAHADDGASMERMIERMSGNSDPVENAPFPAATTSRVNLEVQWRIFKRVANEGNPGTSELQALRNDAKSLGLPSLPTYSLAAIATTRNDALGDREIADTEDLLKGAHLLAPHLPYAQLELARFRMESAPTAPHRAVPAYLQGVRSGYGWLDTRIGWGLKGMILALVAMGLGFVGFLLAQLLRYFGIAAYDGTRILPRGFSSTQTVILLMAVVLVPGLLIQSPLLAMLLLLFLTIPFQQINERLVSIVFLVVIAGLPWIDDALGQLITYPGSTAQSVLHAHYHGCQEECLPWLEELAEDSDEAAYVLASQRFRTASQAEMEELEQYLQGHVDGDIQNAGAWYNLYAAVSIARGEAEASLPLLDRAIEADPLAAPPWFNEMRAQQILGNKEESYELLEHAIRLDMERVSDQLQTARPDPNSFLMIEFLSSDVIWNAFPLSAEDAPSLVTPLWTAAAGEKVTLNHAPWLGIVGLALIFLTLPFYLRRQVSTPCPKCGLARDPNDSDKTNHHHYCLPCYQTFVSGASLDYHARVHSEATLGRRNRFQAFLRRLFSLLAPGVGHILGGHAIRGAITLCALSMGVLILFFPLGPWRLAHELFYEHWAGQALVGWILISLAGSVGLTGLWRGVEPTSVRSSRRRGNS